ncbi:TIGR03086 family metal-binding protein [Streptomyces albiaxialis]
MANELSELMERSAHRTVPVVQGVTDARLGDPTPCSEYDVRDLLNHLFHVVVGFQALAAKGTADFSTTPDYLDGDWRARFGEETGRLVAAWGEPGTLEGKSQGFGMPQRTVAHMVLGDLTVHGWDLARATGQAYAPDDDVVGELLPAFEGMGPMAREMGVLGEEVPVPAGAPPFERLLGLMGRDPRWKV